MWYQATDTCTASSRQTACPVCIGLCRGCASTVAKQLNNLVMWKDQLRTRALDLGLISARMSKIP